MRKMLVFFLVSLLFLSTLSVVSGDYSFKDGRDRRIFNVDSPTYYLEVEDNDNLDFDSENFSISCWVKHEYIGDSVNLIVKRLLDERLEGFQFGIGKDGNPFIGIEDQAEDSTWTDDTGYNVTGEWNNLIYMVNQTEVSIYLNNTQITTKDRGDVDNISNSKNMFIRSGKGGVSAFSSNTSDMRIFSDDLNNSERAEIYNNNTVSDSLVSQYDLNLGDNYTIGDTHPDNVDNNDGEIKEIDYGNKLWLGRPVLLDYGDYWISIYRQAEDHGHGGLAHIRFSEDEGESWTEEDTYINGSSVQGFPLRVDEAQLQDVDIIGCPNGDILLSIYKFNPDTYTTNGTHQYRSNNGGYSWVDEGEINNDWGNNSNLVGGQDYCLVNDMIYQAFSHSSFKSVLYKSKDNGTTWDFVSNITTTEEDTNEVGIEYLGDGKIVTVLRNGTEDCTLQKISNDYGETWTSEKKMNIDLVLQRPRLKYKDGILFLFGRHEDVLNDIQSTTVLYSQDEGASWSSYFYPEDDDPGAFEETGYCDIVFRDDGDIYTQIYGGDKTLQDMDIYDYTFELEYSDTDSTTDTTTDSTSETDDTADSAPDSILMNLAMISIFIIILISLMYFVVENRGEIYR